MSRRNQQNGFALVMTLLVLMVVTIIGISAMRLSFLSLATSTNAQVNMILMGAAKAGMNAITDQQVQDALTGMKTTSLVGGALANAGVENIRCYTLTNKLRTGQCDPTASTDTVSDRGSMFVQVAALAPLNAAGEAQSSVVYGTDDDSLTVAGGYKIVAVVTSSLPVLAGGSAASTDAKNCYLKISEDSVTPTAISVTDCMTDATIPFTTIVREFCVGYTC